MSNIICNKVQNSACAQVIAGRGDQWLMLCHTNKDRKLTIYIYYFLTNNLIELVEQVVSALSTYHILL